LDEIGLEIRGLFHYPDEWSLKQDTRRLSEHSS